MAALLDSVVGIRATVLIIMIPSTIFGAIMIIRSAHFIRNDLSLVVVELQEEQEEHRRQEADPDQIPVLQLSNVDFSYGHVQILFGVNFEVKTGRGPRLARDERCREVDGAERRCRPGDASRGAVRLNGRDITYTTPEQRSRLGIHLLPGGKGVFGPMTVAENLEMGGFVYRSDRAELRRRTERVYELFPAIKDRRGERADSLSGGQQQMLALAIAMLHDPAVLMIDELSLGLAPIIVQELIEVVDGLKAAGRDADHRRAVAQRGGGDRRQGGLPREGPRSLRGPDPRPDGAGRPGAGGVPRRPGRRVMLAVSWLNSQIVFDGIVQGLAVSVIAVGVVLVYRATRIINFAVGNMGVVGAAVLSLLVVQYHVPFWVGFAVALLVGLAFGAIVDLAIIRRLRKSPRVVVLVATIGVSQLAAAIAIKIPAPTELTVHYPSAINGMWTVAGVNVRGSDVSVLIIATVTLVALTWFLDRTTIGRTVKACASNPRLARLSSISPKMVSTMVWALAAALSTLSIVLIAGQSGAAGDLTTLGPQTLSLALVAAVIGGMTSFSRTILASIVIGLAAEHPELQLHRQAGPHQPLALDHRGDRGPVQPGAHRRERGLRVHPEGASHPGPPAVLPLGPQREQERGRSCWR